MENYNKVIKLLIAFYNVLNTSQTYLNDLQIQPKTFWQPNGYITFFSFPINHKILIDFPSVNPVKTSISFGKAKHVLLSKQNREEKKFAQKTIRSTVRHVFNEHIKALASPKKA